MFIYCLTMVTLCAFCNAMSIVLRLTPCISCNAMYIVYHKVYPVTPLVHRELSFNHYRIRLSR